MKYRIILLFSLTFFVGIGMLSAKDFHTLTLKVEQIHCQSCVNKIQNNMKFEKGMKKIATNLETKTVTITYDADKTDVDKIKEGFKKINYDVEVIKDIRVENSKKLK